MIEKCNSTHARKHRKARQAHMKKTVPNEDEFTQRFATERVRPFFGFGAIAACGPKTRKKASPDPFHENMVRKVYTATFLWVRIHFFL